MRTKHSNRNRLAWAVMIVVLLAGGHFNSRADTLDSTKKKEFNQTFAASAGDVLQVDNRYGNIAVTHWNKDEVAFQVIVEVKAGSERRAQEALDRISVDMKKSGNVISAVTSLTGNAGDNTRLSINYHISMPSRLGGKIVQKYGNINMPEINDGKFMLEIKYGNLSAGSFSQPLALNGGYSNITLGDVQDFSAEVAYCGTVDVKNIRSARIDSRYSHVTSGNMDDLAMDMKYGSIKAQTVNQARLEIKYSEAAIERIKEQLAVIDLSYSTLNLRELDANFKTVDVSARYGNLNISISPKASFRVAAENMKYGNVDINGFQITSSNVENKVNHYFQINNGADRRIHFNGNNYSNLRISKL